MTRYEAGTGPHRTDVWIPDPWPTTTTQRHRAALTCAAHADGNPDLLREYLDALGLRKEGKGA